MLLKGIIEIIYPARFLGIANHLNVFSENRRDEASKC